MTRLKATSGWWNREGELLRIYLHGSETYSDWVRNFAVGRIRTRHGYVNRVDHREALAVIREIRAEIAMSKSIVVGGHSRGGAEALSVARELDCPVVLFGPKRTGCRRFVQGADYMSYRHKGDFVPMLPPWYAGYKSKVFGAWGWVWEVHEPREYYEKMRETGFRR